MKSPTSQVAPWLVGAAWLLAASGVQSQSDPSSFVITPYLRATYPNCSIPYTYYDTGDHESTGTYQIKGQGDADGLLGCTTIRGSITISGCGSDVSSITLKDVTAIEGSLFVYECSGLQNVSAPLLQSLGSSGSLGFDDLPLLTDIQMPLLRDARRIKLQNTPLLTTVTASFDDSHVRDTYVVNTGLSSIDFLYPPSGNTIEPLPKSPDGYQRYPNDFVVYDNPNLEHMTAPGREYYQIKVLNNSALGTDISFPKLISCSTFEISSATSLNLPSLVNAEGGLYISNSSMVNLSFPKLQTIDGSLIIANNSHLQDFSLSVPTLGKSGEYYGGYEVSFSDNPQLQTISLQELTACGDFEVSNNKLLSTLNLQKLAVIQSEFTISNNPSLLSLRLDNLSSSGDKRISGNFSSFTISAPQKYSYVDFFVNSTNPNFDCSVLDKQFYRNIIYDKDRYYRCAVYVAGSQEDTAKHWYPPPKGIKRPAIQAAVAILSISGAISLVVAFILLRKRSKRIDAEQAAAVALADLPPTYARVPKPHEVPPVYGRHAPEGSTAASSTNVSTAMATRTVTAEHTGAEQSRDPASPLENGTPTPPDYVELDNAGEPRRSVEEAPAGARASNATTQPARDP